ncbi:hypothetical protein [Paenibacillus sp. N3.4]|uniref:hypothetical protein n=1 Tax=Paenibacillus sp. N3.4 TaxID=2603222 RepID=UPI0011C8E163|nr:hypothetical protein [Paenibacillus sp. N3.4]TXK75130.1 hypothetical protein FU659_27895 [Paenibacillus sp. N3.4]
MINAYLPITAVQSYQVNKDYYRVSGVRATTGGSSNTLRKPLDLPYDGLPYKQFAKSAAKGVADFVQSAQTVKQSAQSLAGSRLASLPYPTTLISAETDSETIIDPIREFVHTYNDFQDNLRGSPEYLNRSLLIGLEQAAKPYSLKELGISKLDDGNLELQESVLQAQVINNFPSVQKSLGSMRSFAASLASTIGQLQQLPSSALFQLSQSALKPFGQYRAPLQAYLPVPMSGLLLDRQM